MSNTMTLNDIKAIEAPADAIIKIVKMKSRETLTYVNGSYANSFRGFHSYGAFYMENDAHSSMTLEELINDLECSIGSQYEWSGNLGAYAPYRFSAETPIAFIEDHRDSNGELSTWYYDGETLTLFITG